MQTFVRRCSGANSRRVLHLPDAPGDGRSRGRRTRRQAEPHARLPRPSSLDVKPKITLHQVTYLDCVPFNARLQRTTGDRATPREDALRDAQRDA
jgi:hypothetical protein